MSYIGNDILSLKDSNNLKSFSNPKYLRKILTDEEFRYLHDRESFFLPYLLWTCKESAYKIAVKTGYNLVFVPQYFEVVSREVQTVNNLYIITGYISFEQKLFYFRSKITQEFISTVACGQENELSFIREYAEQCIERDSSMQMKTRLCLKVSQYFKTEQEQIQIIKNDKGVPYLSGSINEAMPEISLSHDGSYYAYALLYSRT